MITRTNRSVTAPQDIFIVSKGNQALASGALLTSGNAVNLTDGKIGIVSTDPNGSVLPNNFINAAVTALQVAELKVVGGTPNSTQLNQVSAFPVGAPAYIESAKIPANRIVSVTSNLPTLGNYEIELLRGFSAPVAGEDYRLQVTLQSNQNDLRYTRYKRDQPVVSHKLDTLPAQPLDALLQHLASKINIGYSVWTKGWKPFVVFGVKYAGGSGTVIGDIADGTAIDFLLLDGTTYSFTANLEFVASLQTAIAADSNLATATIEVIDAVNSGSAATIDALLTVGWEHPKAVVYDNWFNRKVRVDTSIPLSHTTQKKVSKAVEATGAGDWWKKQWLDRTGLGTYSLNYISDPFTLSAQNVYSPVDATKEWYTSCIIEFQRNEQTLTLSEQTPHRLVLLFPAEIDDDTLDANGTFSFSTTDGTTAAAINTVLAAWINSASNVYSNVLYHGDAVAATIIPL